MSLWAERLKNHQVWQLLQNLGSAIDNAFSREGIDSDTLEGLSRLKSILAFTKRRIDGADSHLVQIGSLDNLSNALQATTQEVQNFVANGNPGHITNANAQADSVLLYLAQLNVPATKGDFLAAKESAESYRIGIKKSLSDVKSLSSHIKNELNSIKTHIGEISAEATAERERLSAIVTDFQTKFATDQESRKSEFTNDQKERQNLFSSLFNDYTQKLGEQNSAFSKQRDDIARLHQDELENLKKQFVDESTKLRDEILKRQNEVEKIVGVIGNLGVTSGYLTTANKAKNSVRLWQLVTVCAMLGFIALAYYAFLPAVQGGFTWSGFAGRVFVSLTVGVLAAYAASQADKYQKIERYNRRLALELEAIGPFIAPLPQDKQEEFRLKIGDRSFGHGEGLYSGIDAKSPATVVDVLLESKEFKSFITDIVKATKT